MTQKVDIRRTLFLGGGAGKGPVIYWMSRDQRLADNWALLYAQEIALEQKSPLAIVFCLVPSFLGAAERQYFFMLRGLEELANETARYNLPFFILTGNPPAEIAKFARDH